MKKEAKEKIIVSFIGLVSVLILLEITLRIIGLVHVSLLTSNNPISSTGKHIILCLGDSFTEGSGSTPGNGYPEQLQRLISARKKGSAVSVINRGRGGHNTTQVLMDLKSNIETLRPDIVVVLAGGANFWNYYGYYSHTMGGSFLSGLLDGLNRIRIYKLIRVFYHDLTRTDKPGEDPSARWTIAKDGKEDLAKENYLENEMMNFLDRAQLKMENGQYLDAQKILTDLFSSMETSKNKYYFTDEVSRLDKKKKLKYADFHLKLATIYMIGGKEDLVGKYIQKAIDANVGDFRLYNRIGDFFARQIKDQNSAFEWYRAAITTKPDSSELENKICFKLVRSFIENERYEEALEFFKRYEGSNNFAKEYAGILRDYIKSRKKMTGEKWENDLLKWVVSDINKIIQICKQNDIKIILLDYPYPMAAKNDEFSILFAKAARERSVSFISQQKIFKDLMKKGGDLQEFFISDGHCNDKGYGIMARKILEKMEKDGMIDQAR